MAYKINPFTGELDRVLGPGNGTASIEFTTDAGTANPTVAGVITIAGGTGINTAGAGSTVTINLDVPVIVANGGTGRTTLTDGAILVGDGTNPVELVGPLTDGQLLIGDTAGVSPAAATLTAGAGIGIVNAAGSITISSTAGGFAWTEVTGTTQAMAIESGYIANNAGLVTLTLPAVAVIGEAVQIVGKGAGLYAIAQNAGQTIHYIASDTTTGVGGSLTAIEQYASIELVCITDNTEWVVVDSVGNFTIV
jgi:hypothetical protein